MSTCDAVVVSVSGRDVWVEVPGRAPSCGNCSKTEACQGSLTGLGEGPRRYRLDNEIGARVGDHVQLIVAEGTLWRASLASYVLPLLLAISGAVVGQSMGGDVSAIAGTLAGLACGVVWLRHKEIRARREGSMLSLQAEIRKMRFMEEA